MSRLSPEAIARFKATMDALKDSERKLRDAMILEIGPPPKSLSACMRQLDTALKDVPFFDDYDFGSLAKIWQGDPLSD